MTTGPVQVKAFYPLGYPVVIATESGEVLERCADSWGAWTRLFETAPLCIRVNVTEGAPARTPEFAVRSGVLAYMADAGNCGEFAPQDGRGWLRVSRRTIAQKDRFRHDFLEAMVLTALDTVAFTPVHAACIRQSEIAVLLCGHSGAGKSSLAYAAAREGWTFLSDDATHVLRGGSGVLVGNPNKIHLRGDAVAHFPELADNTVRRLPNGKRAMAVNTAAFVTQRYCMPPAKCVFLTRRAGPPMLRRYSEDRALEYFRGYAWWQTGPSVLPDFTSLVAGGCWSLEYDSSEAGVATLNELLYRNAA